VHADTRAKELVASGADVINLCAGEPDQRGPVQADDAGVASIRAGETRYGPAAGLAELRAAIASARPEPRKPSEVLVCAGAKQALHTALQALVQPGDEVLLPTPRWVSFPALVELAGGTVISVPTRAERGFVLDPADVEAALGPRTRVLVLNSPGNPTGAVLDRDTLDALGAVAERHDLTVIADEIYGGVAFGGGRAPSLAELARWRPRTVIIDGVSKSHAMTGWRVGWAVGPEPVIAAMARYQGQVVGGPAIPNQRAALAALQAGEAHRSALVATFGARRDRALERLRAIPGVVCHEPAGAIYLFPDCSSFFGRRTPTGGTIRGSVDLQAYLLEAAHVAVVAGAPFGADAHLRLSIAADEERLLEAIGRMGEALGRLSAGPSSAS
jgi:aspartate aminotransferase